MSAILAIARKGYEFWSWITAPSGSYSTQFEIEGGEVVTLSATVTPPSPRTVADVAEGHVYDQARDTRRMGEMLRPLLDARFLALCPTCPSTMDRISPRYNLGPSVVQPQTIVTFRGVPATRAAVALWCLPWCCPHGFEQKAQSFLNDWRNSRGSPVALEFAIGGDVHPIATNLPPSGCTHTTSPPREFASDALGVGATTGMYRADERADGHRCERCWPNNPHHLSDALISALRTPVHNGAASWIVRVFSDACRARAHLRYTLGNPDKVCVTACSTDRPMDPRFASLTPKVICLTTGRRPQQGWWMACYDGADVLGLNVTTFGGQRSLRALRLIIACTLPVDKQVFVLNSSQFGEALPLATAYPPFRTIPASTRTSPTVPACGMLRITPGLVRPFWTLGVSQLLRFANVYGSEEAWLAEAPWLYCSPGPGISQYTSVSTGSWITSQRTSSLYVSNISRDRVWHFTPSRVGVANAMAIAVSSMPRAGTRLVLGRPLPRRSYAIADAPNILTDHRLGRFGKNPLWSVVVIVRAGTTGDRRPLEAPIAFLESLGVPVAVVDLPEQNGKDMLLALQRKDFIAAVSSWSWALGQMSLMADGPTVMAPVFLAQCNLAYTFQPPDEWSTYFRTGFGSVADFCYQVHLSNLRYIHFAEYPHPSCVPSGGPDGKFYVYSPHHRRTVRVMVAHGSGGLTPCPPSAQVAGDDHLTEFSKARVVYASGVGTITTAASRGCRVVSATPDIADRGFRSDTDCGRGMTFGRSPYRLLAHLATVEPAFALPLLRIAPLTQLPAIVEVWLSRAWPWFLYFGLAVALMVWRSGLPVRWGADLHTTIFLTLLPERVGPFGAAVAAFFVPAIPAALTFAGFGAFDVARLVFLLAFANLGNPVFFAVLVSTRSLLRASLLTLCLGIIWRCIKGVIRMYALADGNAKSYLVFSYAVKRGLPLYHVKFVNLDWTKKAEGSFPGRRGGWGGFEWMVKPTNIDDPVDYAFVLPTAVPWEWLELANVPGGTYSALNNCQTHILYVMAHDLTALGPGLVVLAPMLLWSFGVFALLALVGLVVLIVGGFVDLAVRTDHMTWDRSLAGFAVQRVVQATQAANQQAMSPVEWILLWIARIYIAWGNDSILREEFKEYPLFRLAMSGAELNDETVVAAVAEHYKIVLPAWAAGCVLFVCRMIRRPSQWAWVDAQDLGTLDWCDDRVDASDIPAEPRFVDLSAKYQRRLNPDWAPCSTCHFSLCQCADSIDEDSPEPRHVPLPDEQDDI